MCMYMHAVVALYNAYGNSIKALNLTFSLSFKAHHDITTNAA